MAAVRFVEIRGGHEYGHALFEDAAQDIPEFAAGDRIDAGGRLIEENNLGRMDQCAREREFLLHAARQRLRQAFSKRGQPRKIEQFVPPFLIALDPVNLGKEFDIFVYGQIAIQREGLREVADARLDFFRLGSEIKSKNLPRPTRWIQDAAQEPDRGALAGAVGADQAEHFAAVHFQIKTGHGLHPAKRPGKTLGVYRPVCIAAFHSPGFPGCPLSNTKSETRNSKQIRNTKKPKKEDIYTFSLIRISQLRICFGFRYLYFEFFRSPESHC